MWSRMYPGCDPCDDFFCRSTTSHENKMVNSQTQEEVLCDWVRSKISGTHICCILFMSFYNLFLAKGHRGILKRYCLTAQSPECLQLHLVYQSISIVFWSIYFSLQLGSESILCMCTGVSWGDATFAKQVESTKASLTPIKSYCPDTTGGQLDLDPILLRSWKMRCHWCRQGAPETQGVILGKSKIKIYKHDNVVERPQNTTNTILLDVICESIQICDLSFCLDWLNHMHILRSCLRPFHW